MDKKFGWSSSKLLIAATAFAGIAFMAPAEVVAGDLSFSDLSFEESSQYLGIHLGDKNSGADVFSVGSDGGAAGSNQRSALGRINPTDDKPATSPGGGSVPGPLASSGARIVPDGADTPVSNFGGNFALTGSDSQIEFSTTDTYAPVGAGVECANSDCVKDNTNSNYFTPNGAVPDVGLPIGTDQGTIDSGNGVTESVVFTDLMSEILDAKHFLSTLQPGDFTATLDLLGDGTGPFGSAGEIDNYNPNINGDFIVGNHLTDGGLIDGLNIINIKTGSNDFSINNSNFIINGSADGLRSGIFQ